MNYRRARALAVIARYDTFPSTGINAALRTLIVRKGIDRVLTDDALHDLALILIWNQRQHQKFAAASRRHHAAKQEQKA